VQSLTSGSPAIDWERGSHGGPAEIKQAARERPEAIVEAIEAAEALPNPLPIEAKRPPLGSRKPLVYAKPAIGLEPMTPSLRVKCSTN
jgi:hypothetical protein